MEIPKQTDPDNPSSKTPILLPVEEKIPADLCKALLGFQVAMYKDDSYKIVRSKINPHYNSKYAGLDDILPKVVPALNAQGVLLIQPETIGLKGTMYTLDVTTTLIHVTSGASYSTVAQLPLPNPNAITAQALGSMISYLRRYALVSLLGLNVDDDDDGNAASLEKKTVNSVPAPKVAVAKASPPTTQNLLAKLVTHRDPSKLQKGDVIMIGNTYYAFVRSKYKTGKNVGQEYAALLENGNWDHSSFDYSSEYKYLMDLWVTEGNAVDPQDLPF